MAEKGPVPVEASVHQAGGGQQGEKDKSFEVDAALLPHLKSIFESQLGNEKKGREEQLTTFLQHVQEDSLTSPPAKDGLDFDRFLKYITSSSGNILAPPPKDELSWALSNYFISSSHNTYLTGNQLYSDSSTDAYKNVLLRGCRCIEIDIWDGDDSDSDSSDGESDEEYFEKKKLKSANRKERLAKKIPGSISSRLEKTSIGKRLEKYTSNEKKPASGEASSPPLEKAGTAELKKTPSPQAVAVEPRVLHGYTLTKEVSFREVCEAIRADAFTVTDLPLIVSLEVHCSASQQDIMVNIMNEVWSDLLIPRPDSDAESLPSPQDLRRKILVKVKYAPPGTAATTTTTDDSERLPPEAAASKTVAAKQKKPSKIIQALSDFGIYTRGVSYKSLTQPEAAMPTHIFSLSERGVMEVHETQAPDLFKHNQKFMMRTYPSGMRIGSSNLDPPNFWRKGIQIVALNWQKWDKGMMLNEAMFAGTGGYVLKPEGYRNSNLDATKAKSTASTTSKGEEKLLSNTEVTARKLDLKITVYAAQNLPMPEKDDKASGFRPYVKVQVHTEPHHTHTAKEQSAKTKEAQYKAKTKTRKGINPDFEGEALTFKQIDGVTPELAFIRFLVKDDEIGQNDLAAWACVRLDRLRNGFRFVKLMDNHGVESQGVVLVKVEKRLT